MDGKDLAYCRGCGHLSGKGCDYLIHVGHSRGCPPGVGCPLHTAKQAGVDFAEALPAADEARRNRGSAAIGATEQEAGMARARRCEEAERSADRAGTRKRPDTAPIDELRAMQLYNDGLDDIAMADALGVTAKRVQNWRLRMHLKRPKGAKKKEEKAMKHFGQGLSEENEAEQAAEEVSFHQVVKQPETVDAASCRQVSESPETQEISTETAETQGTEASKNTNEEREPITAETMLGLCERIVGAGLGKLPLRINGRDVRDFIVIALVKTPDGAIIEMTN